MGSFNLYSAHGATISPLVGRDRAGATGRRHAECTCVTPRAQGRARLGVAAAVAQPQWLRVLHLLRLAPTLVRTGAGTGCCWADACEHRGKRAPAGILHRAGWLQALLWQPVALGGDCVLELTGHTRCARRSPR